MLCGCADGNINHRVQSKQLYNYTINLLVYWYIHECMHAYMHTCMRAYMHTCINAYMHTCIHAYMHTCIHAYMHTCIHAYMHILGAWRPGYLGNWKSGNLETWMSEELGNLGSWGPGKIAPPKKCHFFIWPLNNFKEEFQLLGSPPRPGVSKRTATNCNGLQQSGEPKSP